MVEDLQAEVRKTDKADRTYVFVKIYGGIAHKLAAESPADAERVLERIRGLDPVNASRYVVAVCSRMARTDPTRARRIAGTMLDAEWVGLKPYIVGLIARRDGREGQGRRGPPAGGGVRRAGPGAGRGRPATLTATRGSPPASCPSSRRSRPSGSPSSWRGPSRSASRGWTRAAGPPTRIRRSALAMIVARYDRNLAARLLRPALDRPGAHRELRSRGSRHLADPRRAGHD